MPPNFSAWESLGHYRTVNVDGHDREIFVIDTGESQKPTLAILHGYPTSIYDYWKALPILQEKYRVVMHDHLGFGLSDKPKDFTYQLMDQATIAEQIWQQLALSDCHLLAHDYGTSVATEILHRHNEKQLTIRLKEVTLCNGSMHIELAQLRPIQKLLKSRITGPFVAHLASKATLLRNFKKIYSDASKVDENEVAILWQLMLHKKGRKVLSVITRYIEQRYTYWDRWIGALQATELPLHVLWAEDDPVAVVAMADVIYNETRNSRKTILQNVGHFPINSNKT